MSKPRHFSDPEMHRKHIAFLRARSQAVFRKEVWELTLDDWFELWTPDLWLRRGRKRTDLALTRLDWDKPWNKNNVKIMPRLDQLRKSIQRHFEIRHGL